MHTERIGQQERATADREIAEAMGSVDFQQLAAACRRDSRTLSGQERRWLIDEVERLQRENAELRDKADALSRAANLEYWGWQGDGHDFPESLACPVVMRPEQLRAMLAEIEKLRAVVNKTEMFIRVIHADGDSDLNREDIPELLGAIASEFARARDAEADLRAVVERLRNAVFGVRNWIMCLAPENPVRKWGLPDQLLRAKQLAEEIESAEAIKKAAESARAGEGKE